MMEEKKEFTKGEFSSSRCVLECSETQYVFSPWLYSLFIVAGVDLVCILALSARCSLSEGACIHAEHVLGWAFFFQIFVIFFIF